MDERPKTLRYRDELVEAERVIVAALPDIIERLINQAKAGDTKAAVYLIDRIMGRAAGMKAAPADDERLPFTEGQYRDAVRLRQLIDSIGSSDPTDGDEGPDPR